MLATTDSIHLIYWTCLDFLTNFDQDWRTLEFSFMKIHRINLFFHGALVSTTPWLLVFISFERFFSIRYPNDYKIIRKKSFQRLVVFIIILFSFLVYHPVFYFSICNEEFNSTNVTGSSSEIKCISKGKFRMFYYLFNFIHTSGLPIICSAYNT